ncbi:hypothetical protein [Haloarcula marina]|uniref:hypothetical protein n=1 Tax=Haloarcula marina TaxID=2961574 RepID=UPI0020B7C0E5|nr:hypothetical protein [Halomicroarcula marina]
MSDDPDAYRIDETGQRVNALELDCHLFFGVWSVVEKTGERWTVRNADGETLTLVPEP